MFATFLVAIKKKQITRFERCIISSSIRFRDRENTISLYSVEDKVKREFSVIVS